MAAVHAADKIARAREELERLNEDERRFQTWSAVTQREFDHSAATALRLSEAAAIRAEQSANQGCSPAAAPAPRAPVSAKRTTRHV